MDENRLDESFRDELGLAIEAAMGVEPAPELKVHVHARIDRERAAVRRWMPWQLAIVGVAAVLIAAITFTHLRRDRNQTDPPSVIAAVYGNALAPYAASAASVAPRIDRTSVRVRAGEVSVSNQAAILAAYVSHVRQLRIDPAAVAVPASSEPLKLSGINIERIAIEPLPKLDAIAGERQ
jgi:hypothetical protein